MRGGVYSRQPCKSEGLQGRITQEQGQGEATVDQKRCVEKEVRVTLANTSERSWEKPQTGNPNNPVVFEESCCASD